jgi:hypothetical protein
LGLGDWVPFRWPQDWDDPGQVEIVRDTPFNCAVGDRISPAVGEALRKSGVEVVSLQNAPVTVIPDARWPRVQTGPNGEIDAGPTGNPWIDANGFAIQVARTLDPGKPIWLTEDPPPRRIVTANQEQLAVCDAEAYGGHWLPAPDPSTWHAVVAARRFFLAHRAWQSYRPVARLAVVSDFVGPHRELALETLNLLTRLNVPYTIGRKPPPGAAMVLDIDRQPADKEAWELATEVHGKLGPRNDLFRLWNGLSLNVFFTASPDGQSSLLQLINYAATVPGQAVTAGIMGAYRSARIYTLDRPGGSPIELHRSRDAVELYLPPFPVYAAIELVR